MQVRSLVTKTRRRRRDTELAPALEKGRRVVLDFKGVDLATQSFIHALLAATVRADPKSLEAIEFKNCNESVRSLIEIVVEYAQQELVVEPDEDLQHDEL